VLADVATMLRSTFPYVQWEAQEDARLPALLCGGPLESEGPVRSFMLSLEAVLARHPEIFGERASH
jgi:hypothetical protein